MGESVDKYKSEYERAKKEFDSILPQIDNKIINRNFFSNYSDKAKKILENGYYYISQYKKAIENYKNSKSTNGNMEKSLERELNEEQKRIDRLQKKIDKIKEDNSKLIKKKGITIDDNISTPWEINKEEQTSDKRTAKADSNKRTTKTDKRTAKADSNKRTTKVDSNKRTTKTDSNKRTTKADSNKRTTKADSNKRTTRTNKQQTNSKNGQQGYREWGEQTTTSLQWTDINGQRTATNGNLQLQTETDSHKRATDSKQTCNGKSQTGNGKSSGQINPNIKIQKAKIKVNGEEIEGNLDLSKVIMPLEYYELLNKGDINGALNEKNKFLVRKGLIDKKKSEKKEIEIEKVNIDKERFDNAKKSHNDKIKKAIEDTELPDERKKRGLFSRIGEMFQRPQFDPKYAFDICSNETKEKIRKLDPDKVDDWIKAAELADISIDYAEEFLARYGKTGYQTICETLGDENKKISKQDIKEAIIDKEVKNKYNKEKKKANNIINKIKEKYGHKNEDQTIEIDEESERIYKSLSKKEINKLKKEGILSEDAEAQIRGEIIDSENEKKYLKQKDRFAYVISTIQERGEYTIIEEFKEGIIVEGTQRQSEIPEYQIIYNQLTDGNEEMKKQIMQYYDEFKTYGEPCMRAVKLICKELAKKRNEIEIHDNGLKIEMDLAYYCDKIGAFYRDPNLSEISDKVYNSLSDESKESMKEDYRSGHFITLNNEIEEAMKSEKTEYSNVEIERNIREKHAREDLNDKAQSIYESFLAEKHESSSSSDLFYDDIERIAIKHKYIDGETLKQYEKLEEDAYKICNEIFSNICAEQYQNEFFSDNDYGYYDGTLLNLFYGGDSHEEP